MTLLETKINFKIGSVSFTLESKGPELWFWGIDEVTFLLPSDLDVSVGAEVMGDMRLDDATYQAIIEQ